MATSVTTLSPVAFDFSKGRAFVQDGFLYYSPNCSRRVVIPPTDPLPLGDPVSDAHLTQPVWWFRRFGWRTFIPLSPSFTSLPFESLCWMPKIIEQEVVGTSEKQFLMTCKDVESWMKIETLLLRAAQSLSLKFGEFDSPPPPSSFGFTDVFESFESARTAIINSRNCFTSWMGYLSFIIAQSESQNIPNSQHPCWYQHLLDDQFSQAWLDGLASSGVCSFDVQTPRAGVVFRWIYDDCSRPDIHWFFNHNVPLFFVWSRDEENMVSSSERLSYLQLPNHLLQQALGFLRKTPNVLFADLMIRRFYHLEAKTELNIDKVKALRLRSSSSYFGQLITEAYLQQHRKRQEPPTEDSLNIHDRQDDQEAQLPFQSMIEMDEEERGKLFSHFKEFFAAREKRQAELLKVESETDRQRRENRERNPPTRKTKMFDWTRVTTSGGQTLHMRVLVPRRQFENFHCDLDKNRKIYNSMANEWDVFSEFSPVTADDPSKTDYEALFSRSDSPDYEMDYLDNENPQDNQKDPAAADGQGVPSSIEPLPLDVIPNAVGQDSSHADDQQDPAAADGQGVPLHDDSSMEPLPLDAISDSEQRVPLHGDGWESLVIADSFVQPLRSYATSYAAADERYTGGADVPIHGRQPALITDSFMESMSLEPTIDTDEGESGLFELLEFTYGCNHPLGLNLSLDHTTSASSKGNLLKKATNPPLDWRGVLLALGILKDPCKFLSDNDMNSITVFISRLSSQSYEKLPEELDTLNPRNRFPTSDSFDFRDVRRPTEKLFIFDTRPSSACSWILGVESAAAALYVCRYILTNPVGHTVLTVADRLLKKGVPFRTLLLLPTRDIEPLSAKSQPLSSRNPNYRYTVEDFEGSMLACKNLLKSPHGRAALLRGGIVGRIAREFLSLDAALAGPSVEVTEHQAGFMSPSHLRDHRYWDDDLSDREINVICGTYVLWTGYGEQTVTLSWFPPPQAWDSKPSGYRWLEWTEKDEAFFLDLLLDIHTRKHQPLKRTQWRDRLRGVTRARHLISNNEERSQRFLDSVCPLPTDIASR